VNPSVPFKKFTNKTLELYYFNGLTTYKDHLELLLQEQTTSRVGRMRGGAHAPLHGRQAGGSA
jgi:hypothetical protein